MSIPLGVILEFLQASLSLSFDRLHMDYYCALLFSVRCVCRVSREIIGIYLNVIGNTIYLLFMLMHFGAWILGFLLFLLGVNVEENEILQNIWN